MGWGRREGGEEREKGKERGGGRRKEKGMEEGEKEGEEKSGREGEGKGMNAPSLRQLMKTCPVFLLPFDSPFPSACPPPSAHTHPPSTLQLSG